MTRKSLSDILRDGDRESLSRAWGETEAAEDFAPLPSGEYVARIVGAELFTSKTKGTAGYKLCFRVLEGDHQGRQFWHDVWLTPAALPMAKRDLAKLGVTALEQLERPLRDHNCVPLRAAHTGTLTERKHAPSADWPRWNGPGCWPWNRTAGVARW